NDGMAPSQANIGHYDRKEFVSTSRRPTVLPDSSLDDDSEVDYRPGEKPSYVAKTPSRPKSYNQSCLKRHDTVQWEDENTLPKCRDSPEIQQLRGQFEQYSQVLTSISSRVDDLVDTATISANENTTVKPPESD